MVSESHLWVSGRDSPVSFLKLSLEVAYPISGPRVLLFEQIQTINH